LFAMRNRGIEWTRSCRSMSSIHQSSYQVWPNKSPEPTAVGACRSAVAVHVASRRWLSFFR
jgi:hypothetical protein